MLSTASVVILFALAATYASDESILTMPVSHVDDANSFTETDAEAWHDNELCPKLQRLFCDETTHSSCVSFDNFFPEKDNPNFEMVNDLGSFNFAQYKNIVEGVKSVGLSSAPGGSTPTPPYIYVDPCNYKLNSFKYDAKDGSYEIVSEQTVKFALPLWGISLAVSEETVTYRWEWDRTHKYELTSLRMESKSDAAKTLANVVKKINDGRRRLMQQKSVQFMMRMPKMISIPLIVGIVVLVVVITMIMIWKSLCFCTETKSKNTPVLSHECEV